MNTTDTKPEKKLPAHLQPWPEHWLPKEEYLAAIKEPRHYWKLVPYFAAVADRNQVTAALGRLVKTGEATRTEKNFYQATGLTAPPPGAAPATWTAAQIAAACEALDMDPKPLLAELTGERPPNIVPEEFDDDQIAEAMARLGTTDRNHPDISRLLRGEIKVPPLKAKPTPPPDPDDDTLPVD